MYYEVGGLNIDLSGNVTTEEMLKEIIEADQLSQEKEEMVAGVNYYNGQNDIKKRDFREYYVDGIKYVDYNKSNDQIVNNQHKTLVDQKQGYICGKPVVVKSEDEELEMKVKELLGSQFQDIVQDWTKNASNKGAEDLQPFITEDGEFDYCLIPGEQIIYITDTTYQKNVVQAIRYYVMEVVEGDETKQRNRVEVWDAEKVTRYQEVDNDVLGGTNYTFIQPGTYGVSINPQYHWYTYNSNFIDKSQLTDFGGTELQGVEGNSWGRVPFVRLKNNSEGRSDLMPIKSYIDALDIVSSGFINDLKDIQLAIWVLRGYDGEHLDEFMLNLQKFKAIKLDANEHSSAEPKTLEIPKEARSAMMEWLEKKIYEVGQGVDTQKITGGSITNVVIKAMYEGLNIKANNLITKMTAALQDFMWYVVEFINARDNENYNYLDVKFVFDKSMLFNTKEKVEELILVRGLLSDRTILSLLPYDIDIDQEIAQIEEERARNMSSMETGFEE